MSGRAPPFPKHPPTGDPITMKLALSGLSAAALLLASMLPQSSVYIDQYGTVWSALPTLSDYSTAEEFDAEVGHLVFSTENGDMFQVDRPLTDEELAASKAAATLRGLMQPSGNNLGATIAANVRSHHPVDEEYIALYSTVSALRTSVINDVNRCDNSLKSNFGIDLIPASGRRWDSRDSATISQLLDEAYRECGGLNGKDIMIALSADPTSSGAIGIAYLGSPKTLVKNYFNYEAEIMQHEVGHNYTLYHCSDNNCIMQPYLDVGAFGNFHNYVDSTSGQNHYSTMNNQRNRY